MGSRPSELAHLQNQIRQQITLSDHPKKKTSETNLITHLQNHEREREVIRTCSSSKSSFFCFWLKLIFKITTAKSPVQSTNNPFPINQQKKKKKNYLISQRNSNFPSRFNHSNNKNNENQEAKQLTAQIPNT